MSNTDNTTAYADELKNSYDRSIPFVQKKIEGERRQMEKLNALEQFPLLTRYRLDSLLVKGDQTTTIEVGIGYKFDRKLDSWQTVVAPYTFQMPLADFIEKVENTPYFRTLVATLILFNFEAPMSMLYDWNRRSQSHFDYLRETITEARDGIHRTNEGTPERARNKLLWECLNLLQLPNFQDTLRYFAWNDRMTVYRNAVHKYGQERFAGVLNPMFVARTPASYHTGRSMTMAGIEKRKALASLSWGKESLLTITLANTLHGKDNVKLGIVQHDLSGDQGYQDAYSKFVPGSPLEGQELSTAKCGYLRVLHAVTPALLGPTHGLHHFYALCHMINNFGSVDVVYMGDEAERTIRNRLYQEDGYGPYSFVYTQDDVDAVRFPELRDGDGNGLVEVGADHTFDFHQSQIMADMLNGLFHEIGVEQRLASLIYPISEMQIQACLQSLNPELFEFQASCWFAAEPTATHNSKWCNSCYKCARLAWMMRSLGIDHKGKFGIDYHDPDTYLDPKDHEGKIFSVDADLGTEARTIVDVSVNYMRFFANGDTAKLDYVLANEDYMTEVRTHLRSHPFVVQLIAPVLKQLSVSASMRLLLNH